MSTRTLNFKHLRYFREVARRGSVATAARALFVTPQTVSAQLQELEDSIGQPLFERVGRRLLLTPTGHIALDYANAIFALGDELGAVLAGGGRARAVSLRVGVTDSVPKLLTVSSLEPLVSRHRRELELVCHEGPTGELLGRLAAGEFDMVLADAPVAASFARSLQARVLSESGMSFLAAPRLAVKLAQGFPGSLDGAPFLSGSSPMSLLGQAIEAWFARHGVRPHIVGRIDDSALLKGFAQRGLGVAAVPTSIEHAVMKQYQLALVGRIDDVRQSVFLIRVRGRRPHPLIAEIEEQHASAKGTA
jgi:LysR family transcriptional activator of nhaA